MDTLSLESGRKYSSLLAAFIRRVHQITFPKYGYLNNGNPDYPDFYGFLIDDVKTHAERLLQKHLITDDKLNRIITVFKSTFGNTAYGACLCHGDLSLRNVIIDGDRLVLIDYDDAMAFPAYSDIARLTFDIRVYEHSDQWRESFLRTYFDDQTQIRQFEKFERIYHIYCAIDWMDFAIKMNYDYDELNEYLTELIDNCARE